MLCTFVVVVHVRITFTMTSILNSRLCKLEKELECMLKNADKISDIQRACFSDQNDNCSRKPRCLKSSSPCNQTRSVSPSKCCSNRHSKPTCLGKTPSPTFSLCDSPQNDSLCFSMPTPACCSKNTNKKLLFCNNLPSMPEDEQYSMQCSGNKSNCDMLLMVEKERRVKAECDSHQMKTEIDLLRMQLEDLVQSKKIAIELSKDLECKYNGLLHEKEEILGKLSTLEKDNRNLCMKLEKEINSRKCYLQQTQKTAAKTKEAIECKLEEIQLEAAKSSKIMAENTEKLAKTLKDKEKRLKLMCQRIEEMQCIMEEKEKEIQKIADEKKELEMALEENKLWNKKLREVNDKLAATVKEYYNKVISAKNEAECLKDEVKCCKENLTDSQNKQCCLKQELEKSLARIECEENKRKAVEQCLEECKDKEKAYQQKIKALTCELKKLEECHRQSNKQTKCEMQKLMDEHSKLKCECAEMQKKLVQFRNADEKRRKCIEEELRLFTSFVNEKESILLKEKEELSCLVNELTSVIKQHKTRISELSKLNKEQEEMLECQCNKIAVQEKSLEHKTKENEYLCVKNQHLEEEIKKLKSSADEKCCEEIRNLEKQISELRSLYCEEKNKLACKEKIIQNQNKLISELRCELNQKKQELKEAQCRLAKVSEELKRRAEEVKRLLKELECERKEKCALIEELKQMECKQKSLENKVAMLEKTVEKYYSCTSKDITKKEEMINCLQQEIAKQRAEFAKQKQCIQQEKEQAICAAKFATQKLYDTVTDFQVQVETQKKVQQFLTGLLCEREAIENRGTDSSPCCSPTEDECSDKSNQECNQDCYSSNSGCNDHCREIEDIFGTSGKYSLPTICVSAKTCATNTCSGSEDECNNPPYQPDVIHAKIRKNNVPCCDIISKAINCGSICAERLEPCSSSWRKIL